MQPEASPPVQPLLEKLSRRAVVPGGLRRVPIPVDRIDLRTDVALYFLDRGFAEPLPFETLHLRVPEEVQRSMPISLGAVASSPELAQSYHALVRHLAREELGFDVVFEANPPLRIYFPGPLPDKYRSREGKLLAYHSDLLVSDYFESINCWLPLSRSQGTNALQCAPMEVSVQVLSRMAEHVGMDEVAFAYGRPAFFELLYADQALQDLVVSSCVPLPAKYGEVIMFDPRLVHGTADNLEDKTRISIDFRLLPLTAYEEAWARVGANQEAPRDFQGTLLKRGEFYDARTAFEL
jgi:hypothetical protein